MALSTMQKGNLDAAERKVVGKVTKQVVALDGVTVTRVTYEAGAKWSKDVKPQAGTESCQLPHVAMVLSGVFRVQMDDGSVQDFGKNDIMMLPAGHDAWVIGDEPGVFVEFSSGTDYYTAEHRMRELVAVGAAVTANCQSCLEVRVGKALESGAGIEEIKSAIEAGTTVRRGAAAKFDSFASSLTKGVPSEPCAADCGCR
jgi:AhpD family alkylhydroperoxidase